MRRSTRRPAALRLSLLLAVTLILSACGSFRNRPELPEPPTREEPPTVPAEPAEPAEPDKGDPQARFDTAMALWQQGQVGEAERALIALLKDFPERSGPWTNLGIIFAKSNRRDQAIGALAKAAALNPDNKVAFNWLGILYREAGDLTRARLSYERALKLDPEYALAHFNYGILLDAYLKRPADALPHYRAYQQAEGNTDDLRVMAWIAEIEAAASAAAAPPPAPPAGGAPKIEQTP